MPMKKTNRRKFLSGTAAAAAAVAAPASARAQTSASGKPVKRVHWADGKPPEKAPLFSGAVSYGNLVFISGIGGGGQGDI